MPARKKPLIAEEPLLEFATQAGTARYRKVGKCRVCGVDLYHCESDPIRADDKVTLCVYTVQGIHCRAHNPYRNLETNTGKPPGERGDAMPIEQYLSMRPLTPQ